MLKALIQTMKEHLHKELLGRKKEVRKMTRHFSDFVKKR